MEIKPIPDSSEQVVDRGTWGPGSSWEFALSDKPLDPQLCTAVACVAIADIDKQEVVLTRHPYGTDPARRDKWEVLAGHIDPLNPEDPEGPRETNLQTLTREAREEAGFIIAQAVPFGYYRIHNEQPSKYPAVAYMPYYWATTESGLIQPTDPNQPDERTFHIETVRSFARSGAMNLDEVVVVEYGLAAALRSLRGVDDY